MTLLYFILMLSVLVAVHEAGHMLMAKLFGVYVREYSIGFGPVLWKKQGKETQYSIRVIPLGGFNKLVEENTEEFSVDEDRTFYGVHPLKRIAIILAGPVANFLLALVILIGVYIGTGSEVVYPPAITSSVTGAAEETGILPGDRITAITYSNGDREAINDLYDINLYNSLHQGEMKVEVDRNGESMLFTLTPRLDEESGSYMMGITFEGEITVRDLTLWESIKKGVVYTWKLTHLTAKSIVLLLTGQVSADRISGTVGVYSYTKQAVEIGFLTYLSLVANISINLGIMNLLPVPVLDGGRIIISLTELVIGHRLNKKVEEWLMYLGFGFEILLLVWVTIKDVVNLFN